MWNGVPYGPGQEAAYLQARIDFPNGGLNGGMGEGGGGGGGAPGPGLGGGTNILTSTPGKDNLVGTIGEQDTFVFTLQDISGFNSAFDPNPVGAIATNSANADTIANFDPGDGDKIRIEDTGTPISVADIGAGFTFTPGPGGYALIQNGTSGVVFTSNDADLQNFDANNFTEVV